MTDTILSVTVVAAAVTGAASLLLWALNAVLNGHRERVTRQREEFAKTFAACVAYEEFPYVVRRRRPDILREERIRISTELRACNGITGLFMLYLQGDQCRRHSGSVSSACAPGGRAGAAAGAGC